MAMVSSRLASLARYATSAPRSWYACPPKFGQAAVAAAGVAVAAGALAAGGLSRPSAASQPSLLEELEQVLTRLERVEKAASAPVGDRLIVVGEGLIDFIPGDDGRFMPRCGGAPFNVCLAMARLEAPTAFLSNVSTDMFGDQICAELARDDVNLDMVKRVANPTTLAFVSFATGEPQYAFFYNDAADRSLSVKTLPKLPADAVAMHLSMGAVTCEVEPVGPAFSKLFDDASQLFLSFDPNIRSFVIPDPVRYRKLLLTEWLPKFDLVKVSDADLAFLYNCKEAELDLDVIAAEWLSAAPNCPLLLITRGSEGTVAYRKQAPKIVVALNPVEVVDTVGAGDSYMGAFLVSLRRKGLLAKGQLANISESSLIDTMEFAGQVAAINCTREGCDPPTLHEVR